MEYIIYVLLIIMVVLSLCDINLLENFYYDTKYNEPQYTEEYRTPKRLDKSDDRPKLQFLLNGIKYKNMDDCVSNCPKYSPGGLKNNNYCIENYGEAVCYPSTW
jgi:hypothetical protein